MLNPMKRWALGAVLTLYAFCTAADVPVVTTLSMEPATVAPGLPVAFRVNVSNSNATQQVVWPSALLEVTSSSGSSYDALVDVMHGTTANISTESWEKCGTGRCLHVLPQRQKQIYVDFNATLIENPFFFDERLSFPGTYSMKLRLLIGPAGSLPAEVWTNSVTLTVSNPTGMDAAVWSRMLQLTMGKGWGAAEWMNQGNVLADQIRRDFSSSSYTAWVAGMGAQMTADGSLATTAAALAANPPASVRDMLLSLKAEVARSAAYQALHSERNVDLAVSYSDIARDAYNSIQSGAISDAARVDAADKITHLYTLASAQAELADLTSRDIPATGKVVPRVECIDVENSGKLSVQFAYSSPNNVNKVLQPGSLNQLSPAPTDQGQPHVFSPGDHPNAFIVHGVTSKLTWRLDGGSATANLAFPARCSAASGRAAIVPLLGCVTVIGGKRMINLGYDNPNAYEVYLPVGAQNHFDPTPQDRSQTTTFAAGRHANAFQIKLDGSPTWTLDGSVLAIPSDTRSCPP